DFLGLRNLTIIKEALRMIRENYSTAIEIDDIPLDDEETYKLFQRGETNAIFQFESDGMKKYMKDLQPDRFGDLIAMNALYRPGPIAYIPNYVNRKHGREPISYDLPEMEEHLAETYGITVYQEQVMLLSQKLADFTKGDADTLRKAMGKKQKEVLDKMKAKFIEGGLKNGHPEKTLDKIWTDWEAFAQYAFNKSHSTCYAFVAYQTAWLKTHYTAEYMAGVLTSQLGNIEKITFFMEECKALGLQVLGPDINESQKRFSVNKKHEIRFGLGGIKGTGDAAVDAIIEERDKNGSFKDIYDFITRVNLRTVNKKTLESLAYAGAFDCFEDIHRAVYFHVSEEGGTFIERLIRYANKVLEDKMNNQNTLFGSFGNDAGFGIQTPRIDRVEEWGNIEKLRYEKEVVGFYISGHPLDQFAMEMSLCRPLDNTLLEKENKDKEFTIGGVVTSVNIRQSKNGNQFGIYRIEDYNGSLEIALFGRDFVEYSRYFIPESFIYIKGKVAGRWGKEDELEFKPQVIDLLSEMKEKRLRELKIKLDINSLDKSLVQEIQNIVLKNPGKFGLKIDVYDTQNQYDIALFSRTVRIEINKEIHGRLSGLVGAENISLN
ncbi:MAG: DNA polymerase III subunit alpha, partial [Leadbetterella sp.]|nr:DNA polymerase III subunit alpha [Leadbetterella sp.]